MKHTNASFATAYHNFKLERDVLRKTLTRDIKVLLETLYDDEEISLNADTCEGNAISLREYADVVQKVDKYGVGTWYNNYECDGDAETCDIFSIHIDALIEVYYCVEKYVTTKTEFAVTPLEVKVKIVNLENKAKDVERDIEKYRACGTSESVISNAESELNALRYTIKHLTSIIK